jgi:hypothetical protein
VGTKTNKLLRRCASSDPRFLLATAALSALPLTAAAESNQARRYDIAEMTDLARIPRELYTTVVYGPLAFDVSSRLVTNCEPLSDYYWRDTFHSDPYADTPFECKAFRYPIVVLLRQAMEINGVPCSGGLVAFHQSERLAYCILSAQVAAGPDELEPGEPFSFDELGNYRYPSESRSSTIHIASGPKDCLQVEVTNAATGMTRDLGSTPTSLTAEVRRWVFRCDCGDGEIRIARKVCVEDCTHTFTCGTDK